MNNVISINPSRQCDDCENGVVTRRIEQQTFQYGVGSSAQTITAEVPVWRCNNCKSAYTDNEAEIARHTAVCRHIHVLTPYEIQKIRGDKSRQEFYELTDIAEASMKRWEKGEVIQNKAMDNFLRLIADPVGNLRLRDIKRQLEGKDGDAKSAAPHFRTTIHSDIAERARKFVLCSPCNSNTG